MLANKKIALVGGRGGMGQLFHRWFEDLGAEIIILGRKNWEERAKLLNDVNLCIIIVPIEVTEKFIKEAGEALPETAILSDFTSLKAKPVQQMLDAHKGPVLGLHPMFGPTVSALKGQKVVVCEGRAPGICAWVVDALKKLEADIVEATPAEHDKMMITVQSIRHFAHFAFGYHLMQKEVDIKRSLEFSSPVYKLELEMVGRMFAQDGMMYADIMAAEPERKEAILNMANSFRSAADLVTQNSPSVVNAVFQDVRKFFGGFCDEALKESSKLIDYMTEREK